MLTLFQVSVTRPGWIVSWRWWSCADKTGLTAGKMESITRPMSLTFCRRRWTYVLIRFSWEARVLGRWWNACGMDCLRSEMFTGRVTYSSRLASTFRDITCLRTSLAPSGTLHLSLNNHLVSWISSSIFWSMFTWRFPVWSLTSNVARSADRIGSTVVTQLLSHRVSNL